MPGHSQNKGLSEYQRRASQQWTGPSPPEAGRQADTSQSQKARGKLGPRNDIFYQLRAGSQLLTKSSWDPGQLTSARRVTARDQLPRREIWHTGDGRTLCHPGNRGAGTREVIKTHSPPWTVCSPRIWSPEFLTPGKGPKYTPNQICAFVEYPRT